MANSVASSTSRLSQTVAPFEPMPLTNELFGGSPPPAPGVRRAAAARVRSLIAQPRQDQEEQRKDNAGTPAINTSDAELHDGTPSEADLHLDGVDGEDALSDVDGEPRLPPDPAIVGQIELEIPRLRRFARAMVRDATLADDLVQECLERALSRLHLWRPGSNLRAWLFTILRNLHINGIRRRQNVVDIDGEGQANIGAAHGAQFVRLELRDLKRSLALLPTEQREVVLLIGLEGISYGEAADILGISIGTVKSRLSRGRRALKALMDGRSASDDD